MVTYVSAGLAELSMLQGWVVVSLALVYISLLFVIASARLSAIAVGGLWILHGLYDLTHGLFFTNPGIPGWYPVFCFSVDVVVGAYVLWLSRHIPEANLRRA